MIPLSINDILICRKSCIMNFTNKKTTTIGKSYKIIDVNETRLYIIDDENDVHSFLIDEHYNDWFYPPIKIQRKEKLLRLKTTLKYL